ncbi:MAG: 50S ribosomal protein L29 [candidate division Zixibacteria bacterium]|nr:50S ribosomal protein L29 [candidate division Zixibacteria bacterium]
MKISTLRELTRDELLQRRKDLEEELFNLRMRRSVKTLDNPLRLRHIGRDVGQIMTLLREDELGIRKLAESKTGILGEKQTKTKTKAKKES